MMILQVASAGRGHGGMSWYGSNDPGAPISLGDGGAAVAFKAALSNTARHHVLLTLDYASECDHTMGICN